MNANAETALLLAAFESFWKQPKFRNNQSTPLFKLHQVLPLLRCAAESNTKFCVFTPKLKKNLKKN